MRVVRQASQLSDHPDFSSKFVFYYCSTMLAIIVCIVCQVYAYKKEIKIVYVCEMIENWSTL